MLKLPLPVEGTTRQFPRLLPLQSVIQFGAEVWVGRKWYPPGTGPHRVICCGLNRPSVTHPKSEFGKIHTPSGYSWTERFQRNYTAKAVTHALPTSVCSTPPRHTEYGWWWLLPGPRYMHTQSSLSSHSLESLMEYKELGHLVTEIVLNLSRFILKNHY